MSNDKEVLVPRHPQFDPTTLPGYSGWCVTTAKDHQMIQVGNVFFTAHRHGDKLRFCVCAPRDVKINRLEELRR